MHVCIFEDNRYRNFLPLAYFRPVYELRCGASSLRSRIEDCFPRASFSFQVREQLARLYQAQHPARKINVIPEAPGWFVNGRILADAAFSGFLRKNSGRRGAYLQGGQLAAAYLEADDIRLFSGSWQRPLDAELLHDVPASTFDGTLVEYPWELVLSTAEQIPTDFQRKRKGRQMAAGVRIYPGAHLLNKKEILLGAGTVIKPGAVLDAETGPIVLGKGVTVMANAVIEGPVSIGDHSLIKAGARIYHGTSIGEHCKVGGEVDSSIIGPYSNKQHEGFLGHSYIGSWVNIGADTNTSDLKNTYGTVKVTLNGEEVDTGYQFVGLVMGDHSKTGINVMFDAGTVVGVSCNVYGAGVQPRVVPSFSWGKRDSLTVYRLEKSIETARRMMVRRSVELDELYEKLFRDTFGLTEGERRGAGIG